jgi:hypothetical protein
MLYRVTFINAPTQIVRAINRADAITQAVRKTRGYLSCTEQRSNVISAKIDQYN